MKFLNNLFRKNYLQKNKGETQKTSERCWSFSENKLK